jgi:hypothetical protein
MRRAPLKQKTWSYGDATCVRAIKGESTVNLYLDRDGLMALHAAVTLALVELQKVHRGSAAGRRAGVKMAIFPAGAPPKIMLGRSADVGTGS